MDSLRTLFEVFFDTSSMWAVLPEMITYGLVNTLILASVATVLGVLLGLVIALMGLSNVTPIRLFARVYTDIFRGLPAILTILLIGQGLARFTNSLTGGNPYPLGILALALISSAYIGEIFRGGILSIDKGQMEASRALGMSQPSAMRLVVVPQAVRTVLPSLVNQFISIIKDSSLVYFLGFLLTQRELFRVGQDAAVTEGNLSPLVLAGVFYLVITVPLTHLVNYIDDRLRKGKRVEVDVEDLPISLTPAVNGPSSAAGKD